MQLVQDINRKCEETLPLYSNLSNFTVQQYKRTVGTLDHLYQESKNTVIKAEKTTIQLRNDIIWMLSQAANDLLDLTEKKLDVDTTAVNAVKERNKVKRLQRIYAHIRKQGLEQYLRQVIELNQFLVGKARDYNERYVIPKFVTMKATILVSRQMMMEMFSERMTKLRLTCRESKDTITMFWRGEFKEDKILDKFKENLGEFKQFTINFYNKGLEVKISRDDLTQNYRHVVEKISEIMKDANEKRVTQWTVAKTRTASLYQTVLNRIKEKEVQIRREMLVESVLAVPTETKSDLVEQKDGGMPSEPAAEKKPSGSEEGEKETSSENNQA